MRFARSLVIAASTALPLASVTAQSDSASSSTPSPAKWELSVGVDPAFNLGANPGFQGHFVSTLTRNWQSAHSRYSRRLSLMIGRDIPRYTGSPCYGCRMNREYAALTAGISADLFHAWRLTPYVHSGAGLYYTHLGPMTSVIGGDALIPGSARNEFSPGLNAGLGIKARLFSHEFFIDGTVHAFDVRAFDHASIYPLSIGVRW